MKSKILYSIAAVALVFAAAACDKQDDSYRQYVVNGGYNYPAKPAEVVALPGFNKVAVSWAIPQDPAVKSVKVFWDNYADSMSVDYSSAVDGVVTAIVDGLEERSYTFDIVNYDGKGNKSLASEITASPYGAGWLATHAERRVRSIVMQNDSALVTLGNPVDEMVCTVFRYKDADGKVVESDPVSVDSTYAYLAHALKGKYVEYRSAYCPAKGVDLVWNENWTRTVQPINYKLDASDWVITYTKNQQRSADYGPANMFDGDYESRYYSSTNTTYRKLFPKIISIDTKAEGDARPVITGINVYQHPTESKSRYVKAFNFYVGDEAYNPDDADYMTTFGPKQVDATLNQNDAVQSRSVNNACGRYLSIVFRSSYSTNGYIDVWEFDVIGFVPSEAE